MTQILRKNAFIAALLLFAFAGYAALFERPTGAAELHQAPPLSASNARNSAAPVSSLTRGEATTGGEVQIVVTTNQGGILSSRVIATVANPGEMTSEATSSLAAAPNQTAAAGDIVFSQIYASGGNPGSTFQNNYLEVFNRTNNTVDINSWKFYIADATGTSFLSISFVSSRGIGIGPGKYLLIQFGDPSTNGSPVPNPDFIVPATFPPVPGFPPIPPFNLSPSGKVFLTGPGTSLAGSSCPLPNAAIVDFVGYGNTANCFEGAGPVATLSNITAAIRQANGCTDTDNNGGDFSVGAPNPRNSGSTPNFCSSAPPEILFSQASISVTETSSSIGLLVLRNGNTSGASTVDYATSDTSGTNNCNVVNGNASSRCDYIASIGTLQFAAGETFKQIAIPLVDDAYSEGTENFSITLSNPTSATLGAITSANIVLNDNDSTNGTNQIDQAGFFVREHYVDFLNREPDGQGNNFWIGEINNCTPKPQCTEIKRINVSAAFFLSIEFQETGYLAHRAYKAAYGDATGQAMVQGVNVQIPVPIIRIQEFLADSHAIGDGVVVGAPGAPQKLESNKVAFFAAFVARQRFLNDYPPTMTPTEFVDKLNLRAGNVLSTSERDTLISQLQSAPGARAQVVRAVAEDGTLNANESNRAFVLMQYFGYLRRNPNDPQDSDYTGYKFWLDKLNEFNGNFVNAEMVKAFITSGEYRQRFGQ